MLIELISLMVMNGSAWGPETYQPWLPFYNFFPIIAIAGIAVILLTRSLFWGIMAMSSSVWSLIPTYAFWEVFDLDPLAVFGWWLIHNVIIYAGQVYLLKFIRARKQEMKKDAC